MLIDKSVGPQESGQRAVVGSGGAGPAASPPAPRPPAPHPRLLSRFLRTDRLVDEYQFKRFVSFRFVIPIVFYRFCIINTKRNETFLELNETNMNRQVY